MLRVVLLLCCTVVALSVSLPGAAAETRSANLASGETTQDGRLTFVVAPTVTGAVRLSLRNNDLRTIVVDAYTISRGSSYSCGGMDLQIPGNESQAVCTVADTGAANLGTGRFSCLLRGTRCPSELEGPSPPLRHRHCGPRPRSDARAARLNIGTTGTSKPGFQKIAGVDEAAEL